MGHKVNGTFQNKSLVAGLNTVVATYTLSETASGSTTIAICGLPGGAQVVDLKARINHAGLMAGAGRGLMTIYATVAGNTAATYLGSSTASTEVMVAGGTGLGTRLTGSANLVIELADVVATGTASTVFTVMCTYLAELSSD